MLLKRYIVCVCVIMYWLSTTDTQALLLNITKTRPCKIQRYFSAVKIDQKNFDIFSIFAQNINCGYTLEPPC